MDNCILSVKELLDCLQVKYTKSFIKDSVLTHPNYPSLLCISDTLGKYGIETLTVKVDAEKLLQLPLPCIVQLSGHGGLFCVLAEYSKDKVVLIEEKGKRVQVPHEIFLNRWTGVCLLAEATKDSKEPGIQKRLQEKYTTTFLAWTIMVLLSVAIVPILMKLSIMEVSLSFFLIGYSLLKLVGLVTGIFLLWYEVDKHNPTLRNLCSRGQKINCEAVLGSEYAKIFNNSLSLGLLGFSYFFGTLLYLVTTGFSSSALSALTLLSFATIPVIILSTYYQKAIIKQWCRLCIIIKGTLALEIIFAFFGEFYTGTVKWETLPLLFLFILSPIWCWKLLKPLLESKKESRLYNRELKRIKNNPDVWEGLLMKMRKIKRLPEGLGISINQNKAKYHLIKVCNPYCKPCANAHPVLEELANSGKINLQILFTASTDKRDPRGKPVSHFLAIDTQGDKSMTQRALNDWYKTNKKDYKAFANKYPMNGELEEQEMKIASMKQWCDAEKITHTPTIFINGYELPNEYHVEDLKEVLI